MGCLEHALMEVMKLDVVSSQMIQWEGGRGGTGIHTMSVAIVGDVSA